jgi:hypothetical protein
MAPSAKGKITYKMKIKFMICSVPLTALKRERKERLEKYKYDIHLSGPMLSHPALPLSLLELPI